MKLRQVFFHWKNGKVKSTLHGEGGVVCLGFTTSFLHLGAQEGAVRIWHLANGKKIPITIELDLPLGSVGFELERMEEG